MTAGSLTPADMSRGDLLANIGRGDTAHAREPVWQEPGAGLPSSWARTRDADGITSWLRSSTPAYRARKRGAAPRIRLIGT